MTTTTAPLEATRLFHREALDTITARVLAGRRVFVAASTIAAGRQMMRQLEAAEAPSLRLPGARFFWAKGMERIEVAGAGSVVFNSIGSMRVAGLTADVALVNYQATDAYLEWLLPALVLGGTTDPELFEIDA